MSYFTGIRRSRLAQQTVRLHLSVHSPTILSSIGKARNKSSLYLDTQLYCIIKINLRGEKFSLKKVFEN